MTDDPELTRQFAGMGPEVLRRQLDSLHPNIKAQAIRWLSQQDREERERANASAAEQLALARSTRDLASAANTFAERSARAAKTSNRIAAAALIAAVIAIVVSIIGLMHH